MNQGVAVYTKSHCVQCTATKRWLAKNGVEFTEVDLEKDNGAWDYVTDLGAAQAPVVVLESSEWWTGHRPEKLNQIMREAA